MPGPTPKAPPVALARLAEVVGANDRTGVSVTVHFNPESLELQLSNELKDVKGNERKQYVAKTSAKLTMDLLFDTTDTGADVTGTTRTLQAFLAPPLPESERERKSIPPPLVLFEWGTLRFKGIVESYRETLDFFSADGVPLRSSVRLTISRQDQVFDEAAGPAASPSSEAADGAVDTDASSAADLANRLDAPGSARTLAAENGQENLRFGSGPPLTVRPRPQLQPPSAFTSAGAAEGLPASVSASVPAGASAGVSSQARLSASEGAFAALRAAKTTSGGRLGLRRSSPGPAAGLAANTGGLFKAGGQALTEGAAGLSADVGARSRLRFD